jgi:hypothetical protein
MSNYIDPEQHLSTLNSNIEYLQTLIYDDNETWKADVLNALTSIRTVLETLIEAHNDSRS